MQDSPSGEKATSALTTLSVAQRIADSLHLRAQALRSIQKAENTARGIISRLANAARVLRE